MRKLLITLPEDTSGTHCGLCPWSTVFDGLGDYLDENGEPKSVCGISGIVMTGGRRDDVCLESERAAARLLDVSPEDCATYMTCGIPNSPEEAVTVRRIQMAIREHAKKAGG